MSRTPMYDPMASDARSSWLSGLTEACNKISGVLDMKIGTFENLTLPELYISEQDRFRIYQAPLGNKLWLATPAPVIKKNGTVITPELDGFTIDYLGGSIAFEDAYTLTEWDVITADATYIIDGSNKINDMIASIESIAEEAGKNKGSFKTIADLESAYPAGTPGDFAIISSENAIYIWDDTAKEWVNANAKIDLSEYFKKEEIESLLNEKQDEIAPKQIPSGSTESAADYFYSGDKTWVSLLNKIRGCALSGLVTNDSTQVEAADTLLTAIGKLQAQINSYIHPIIGNSAPTTSTVGVVGQDYINSSNGEKYHCIRIDKSDTSTQYIWVKYGDISAINFEVILSSKGWKVTVGEAGGTKTVFDNRFSLDEKYTYFVSPISSDRDLYIECGITHPDKMSEQFFTFTAKKVPDRDIKLMFLRLEGTQNG